MSRNNTEIVLAGLAALAALWAFARKAEEETRDNRVTDPTALLGQYETGVAIPPTSSGAFTFAEEPGQISNAPTGRPTGIRSYYYDAGDIVGVDPLLLEAIGFAESSHRPDVKNILDPSYGLMQILCVADGPNSPCKNRLNIPNWELATPNRLLNDPLFNALCGAYIIRWNIETYSYPHGIAVYNNWAARNDPSSGPYRNQSYVTKVVEEYERLRKQAGKAPVAWNTKYPALR